MALKKFTIHESFAERMAAEDAFFDQKFFLSYSGLNKLLYSPALFYKHYILKQRDDTTSQAMTEGKLIHCLLLTPDRFENEYQIISSDLPSANPKLVIDRVFEHYQILKEEGDEREELNEFGDAILDILKDMNLYQSLKTDEQRILKITEVDKHVDYWWYIKNTVNKTLIPQELYDFAQGAVEKMKCSVVILKAMGFILSDSFMPNIEVYNEIELICDLEDYSFGLKGFIDNLVIDHDNKVIKINDLKTTSKDLTSFKDSIEFYSYWMQLVIYSILIKNSIYYKEGYSIEHRFLVIDVYQQVGSFLVTEQTLNKWYQRTIEQFDIAEYHLKNKFFELPYEFAVSNGEICV
jgi:hypothetical protein